MRYLFLLNPTAGKRDCTTGLTPAIHACLLYTSDAADD